MDVFCTVLDIISVCGSIPIEIPILWPRAVVVGPRPRVILTLPMLTVVVVKVVGCTTGAVRCVTHGLGFDTYHLGSCMFIAVGEHRVIILSDYTAVVTGAARNCLRL